MKKNLFKYITFIFLELFCLTKSHSQSLPISSYGVWDRGGQITDFSDPNVDFVKGIEEAASWENIELVKGTFDFSLLQIAIDKAYANNKLVRLSVQVGPDSPLWIYDNDTNPNNNPYPQVQKVTTSGGNDKVGWPFYPEYLSQTYQDYLWLFLNEFSNFLRSQPAGKFAKIAFVQVKTGCTGDEVPYKGKVDNPIYEISDAQWFNHRLMIFQKYKEFFNDVPDRKIVLCFNDMDPSDPNEVYAWNWLNANINPAIGFGIKGGAFNRGHHLSSELNFKNSLYSYLVNPTGLKLFSAAEMDGTTQDPYFQICEDMSYYWAALGGINVGLSTNNLNAVAMDYAKNNPSGRETFRMFTRYAQQVYPSTANTAFSVFHDGLNAEDTNRFPEAVYGNKRMDNQARYQAICDDPIYYNRGARMDHLYAATQGQVYQRANQTGLNDSGFGIAEGNIERFMTQINPNETSIGLFRVRGPITTSSSKYDRFARSFENATGKNTMYFKLDNELPASNKTLKFTIIWLDKTVGSTWAFNYRNSAGLQSIPFTGTGSNEWKTQTFQITNAIINQGGTNGSDFMLVNTDTIDDIFNGIEMNILQSQTINFNAIPSKKVGDADFIPGALASSGLAVTYTSSNTNVATIVDGNIHIVAGGACTITASQDGNNYYGSAVAVAQYLSVVVETQTIITTSGQWICPTGVNTIKVEAWGGGGSGGSTNDGGVGGGGAGGSYVINNNVVVVPGLSYGITVGAGGIASTNISSNGTAGGNTTFASTISVVANGGAFGNKATGTKSQNTAFGLGGINLIGGSGGTVTLGSAGDNGTTSNGGKGGNGGGPNGGTGGASDTSTGGAGNSGSSPGGGGSGAFGSASGVRQGGAGGAGSVRITYTVSVPSAPVIGTATVSGVSGQALIPFTAPSFNGNATITTYTATSSPGGITGTLNQAGSGTIIVNGLTNGTSYTFTVRATNSTGESDSSSASNTLTPVTVPDAPIIGTAALTGVLGQARISFTAPASNGGLPITSYTATSLPGGLTGTLNQAGNGIITINGLTNGTSYIFTVRATNSKGQSAASVGSNAVIPVANTPQTITFDGLAAVNYGDRVFPVASASSGLPITYTSNNPLVATTSGSTITVVGAGSAIITASQGGDDTYTPATSVSQTLVVNKKPLLITAPSIASKVYNSLPASGHVTAGTLSGFLSSETVTATATGLYADANVGTSKLATITYVLADGLNGGKAANYSLANGTTVGSISQAPLTIEGVVANDKVQDGNTTVTLNALGSLSGVFAADTDNVTLNRSSVSANFDTASAGSARSITISGYSIFGSASANYSLSQPTGITANIVPTATITAEGTTTFCSGASVTLSANAGSGLTYLWSTGATTQSIAATASGSYMVTVTGAGGSTTSAATTVTVNPVTTKISTVTAFKTYTWSAGNENTYTASGTYNYVVGCHTETLVLTITNIPPNGSSALSFCAGATIARATANTSLKFYMASSGGTALVPTTALATKTYYVTETINNVESTPRTPLVVTVSAIPAETLGAITSSTTSTTTTTGFAAAMLSVGQYVGTTTTVSYRIPAFSGTGLTYLWKVPTGVRIVGQAAGITSVTQSGPNANILNVNYYDIAAGVGSIGAITVQAQNANGCTGAVKSITVVKVLPAAPAAIKMTDASLPLPSTGIAAAITSFAKYMGTDTELTLTATPSATAISYEWELPTGVTQLSGGNSNVITVKFKGVTNFNTYNYSTTAAVPVSTNLLRIGVKSVNGVGVSITSNSTLANASLDFYPNSTSTARLLTLKATKPASAATLILNNGLNTTAITSISKMIGLGATVKLLASTSALASSYSWELPACVTRVTDLDGLISDATATSTNPFIYVKFNGTAPTAGSIYFGVKAENGLGSSMANNLTASPATSSTAKLLRLVTTVPATPSTLALYDLASTTSTTAVTSLSSYIGKSTKLKLTAGTSVLSNTYSWKLPTGVKRVSESGETIESTTSTDPFIYVNFANVPHEATSISLVFVVNALNNIGPSLDKSLTVTAGLPSAVTTVSNTATSALIVCNRATGFEYTISAPMGANKYQITAPAGSIVTSASASANNSNVLETSDLTFKVVYPLFISPNNKLVIKSGNAFGLFGTGKSYTMVYSTICPSSRIALKSTLTEKFSVIVYPNPSTDLFNIDIQSSGTGVANIQVYDMAGRLIEQRQVNSTSVEVGRNYASGLYEIIVTQGANTKTLRVIKQ